MYKRQLPPHHEKYREYSRILNSIYLEYTDLVEPFSVDESWLDVTASEMIMGDAKLIADSIRERIKRELGLTLSAGVSFNKIFAKMGSDYKKPDATTVISRQNFKRLLWPCLLYTSFRVFRDTVHADFFISLILECRISVLFRTSVFHLIWGFQHVLIFCDLAVLDISPEMLQHRMEHEPEHHKHRRQKLSLIHIYAI